MLHRPLPELSFPQFRYDEAANRTRGTAHAILVALDGGLAAERALPVAHHLARHWSAPLRLVHIRNPVEEAHHLDVVLVDEQHALSVRTRSSAYLEEMAASLRDAGGPPVSWDTRAGTSVNEALRSQCETDARALVMVRTKRSTMSRMWWGSISDRLIGRLSIPLLLVPEIENESSGWGIGCRSGFQRVLTYLDGREATNHIIATATDLASDDAVCHLLRVLPTASMYAPGWEGFPEALDLRHEVWGELFEAEQQIEKHGLTCTSRLIFDGQRAGPAIVRQAQDAQVQLIVLPARRHLLPWWLRDGVAEYVVRHANVPVLIVPDGNSVPPPRENPVNFRSN